MEDSEDFDDFLKNVDEISKLVKELSSPDTSSQVKAMERADSWLEASKRTGRQKGAVNRTVINSTPPATGSPTRGTAFMRMLEKDAEERSKRRKVREEKAKALKARGNAAFAEGDYESAVLLYTQGLEQLRDMQELYTNRAQCNEGSVKAYVHMGRAHLGLSDYAKARECYVKILEIAPEREAMVKDYLSQVEKADRREREERLAREECQKEEREEEVVSVATVSTETGRLLQLLRKLDRPNEMSLYYCGGVELLSHAITDRTGQTIFRLQNGFSIINGNSTILR
ncbi:hypothetical protein ACEWY4_018714 [Coilia grayii]|uniref:Tetratricopeptide repeat protein 12 n=1 Tax=Coilia grayii TaxID=363190 RepID=A0ABD1JEA5_9TELE